MRLLLTISLLVLAAVSSYGGASNESHGQIWSVGDRRWTVEEERLFGKWVEENVTEDFFVRHRIAVDCADVPYAIRWIYSRIAHLPAAATAKGGRLIGHWSTDWKHLPTHPEWQKDERFRAALRTILEETTTRTLPQDTYPVRISVDSVTPGTAFFITESHSGIIGHVSLDGSSAHPLQTWEATLPVKIQKMSERSFLSPRPESIPCSGLVKFRWPVFEEGKWQYLPAKEHPFYSEEQYTSAFYDGRADYVEAVARKMDPKQYDPWQKMENVMETTARYLRDRVPIVLAGYQRCRTGSCGEGSELWEIHSTPGRDGMIILLMDHLKKIIETNHLDAETVKEKMESIRIDISKDRWVTFLHVYQNYLWLSPRPEDPLEARWGMQKCEMILSQIRSAEKSIAFIDRTYRRRDPKYADFSTGQQRDLQRRLVEEWASSQCEFPLPSEKKRGR